MKNPRHIVITGASGGIGQALAAECGRAGVHMLLFGRNPDRLRQAADMARASGAQVSQSTTPVTDHVEFAAQLSEFHRSQPIDLLILAAGVKTGNQAGIEPPEQLDRVLDVNLRAVMHAVQAVLPLMQERASGQIALFSSIASLSPHADLLSYSASKAALRAYGTALRRALWGSGVTVSIITPGFVDTPMTDRQLGRKPFLVGAPRAAGIIRRGLQRKRAFVTFPAILALLIRLENLLPSYLGDLIDRSYRARILPDQDEVQTKR